MTLTHDVHAEARAARAKAVYFAVRGPLATLAREAEINTLPVKMFKGKKVYRIRCHGEFGNGPHDMWVPAGLLWALISLDRWRCPYHA